MATTTPSRVCEPLSAPPIGDPQEARYWLGRRVVLWIQRHCVYGPGSRAGQAVKLEKFQVRFLLQLYELGDDGVRRYRRALLEMPKGNGKTPLSAWVGMYELCNTPAAEVVVAAASYKQAGLLYGDAKFCAQGSPTLSGLLSPFQAEIQRTGTPSVLSRVAAIAGTNDGKRPTAFLADEIHEWLDNKAEVHGTIERGVKKRYEDGSFTLNTTTPGADIDSLAGDLHTYGVKVNNGEVMDREGFLFVWYGCPDDRYDLSDGLAKADPEQFYANLRSAVQDANPAAGSFLNVDSVAGAFPTMHRLKFFRYHLGLWTRVMLSWLPTGAWDACAAPDRVIEPGTAVVLGVDGSVNQDTTAVIVATVEAVPHLAVGGVWERPEQAPLDWSVPIREVEARIRELGDIYVVVAVIFDPFRWKRSLQVLAETDELTGAPPMEVLEMPQNASRMIPATARFYEGAVNGLFTQDGDPVFSRHVGNARTRQTTAGMMLSKDSKHSSRKIDLAVAAVMAFDQASLVDDNIGANAW